MMNGQFEVPEGLTDVLEQFVIAVLRNRPSNIIGYAASYFADLNGEGMEIPGGPGALLAPPPTAADDSSGSESEAEAPANYTTQRRKSVKAEPYDPSQDADTDDDRVIHPKTYEERQKLVEVIAPILLFKTLDKEQLGYVIDAMFLVKVESGHQVIIQGAEDADNFYVIQSGSYQVEIDGSVVHTYTKSGASFGELALLYNQPRAATIRAADEGSLWALDRLTFRRIVLRSAFLKRQMYEQLIESVSLLDALTFYEKMSLADALISQEFEDEEVIIQQGDSASCMYFVETGEVRVIKKDTRGSGMEKEVARCQKGGFFGELALLTKQSRAATVISVGSTKCAVLAVDAFERLLGPCKDIMHRNHEAYERNLEEAFGGKVNISDLR